MRKFKVGEKVRVRADDPEDWPDEYDIGIVEDDMREFCGQIVTIDHVSAHSKSYGFEEDGRGWCWSPEWFSLAEMENV